MPSSIKSRFFSLRNYAIAFLLFTTLAFALLAWYTITHIQKVRDDINQSAHESARKEFLLTSQALLNTAESLSSKLSQWDEVFQQLEFPAYYYYWHTHRLMNSNVLPSYIKAAVLYNGQGKSLINNNGSHFPEQIPANQPPTFYLLDKIVYLKLYLPIQRSTTSPILGYMGVKISFLESLKQQHSFSIVDTASITYHGKPGTTVSFAQGIENFQYSIIPNPEANAMMEVINTTSIHLGAIVLLLSLALYLMLMYVLGYPVLAISSHIDRLRSTGDSTTPLTFDNHLPVAEFENVRISLNQYQADLCELHNDLKQKNKELWHQAHHDALTNAGNRRGFDLKWQAVLTDIKNTPAPVTLMLFDINHFKSINDTYGHETGDEVLMLISRIIGHTMPDKSAIYRIGGDEFAAIFLDIPEEHAMELAKSCLQSLHNHDYASIGIKEPVRVSIGIAHASATESERVNSLMWQADMAVYQAKRPSVNYPVAFSDDMVDGSESLFSSWINNAIYEAVTTRKGLETHYQTIVNSDNQSHAYYEALVRIRHKDELIQPQHIFPLIEARGLEADMDHAVIQSILADINSGFLPKGSVIAINLSAASVVHPELINWLEKFVSSMQDFPIILEVTETSLITKLNHASKNLEILRSKGFTISLDDFGSGYSSLQYLVSMPVDKIKFDITLIRQIDVERSGKMIRQLASILKELGYELVAEGVETEDAFLSVKEAGFDFVQGFWFGKPERKQH